MKQLLLMFFTITMLFSNQVDVIWEKESNYIVKDSVYTGEYFVTLGASQVSKYDSNGALIWHKDIATVSNLQLTSISTSSDGSLIAVGTENTNYDIHAVKLDLNGTLQWSKSYSGSEYTTSTKIINANDDGFIIAGQTSLKGAGESDFWILKIDDSGNLLWDKTYGTAVDENIKGIVATTSDSYIITGKQEGSSWAYAKSLTLKIDNAGVIVWEKTSEEKYGSEIKNLQITSNEEIYLIGISGSPRNSNWSIKDIWISKLDTNGVIIWENTYGGATENFYAINDVIRYRNNLLIVTPHTLMEIDAGGIVKKDISLNNEITSISASINSIYYTRSGYLAKASFLDNTNFKYYIDKQRDINYDNQDILKNSFMTLDDGYISTGYTSSYGSGEEDYIIIKYDVNNTLEFTKVFGGTGNDYGVKTLQKTDGKYILAGYTNSKGAGGYDFWVMQLSLDGTVEWEQTYGGVNDEKLIDLVCEGNTCLAVGNKALSTDNSDAYAVKFSSIDGSLIWEQTYGAEENDSLNTALSIGEYYGYILAGSTSSKGAGGQDGWVIKIDSSGTLVWDKTYGTYQTDNLKTIIADNYSYTLAGSSYSYPSQNYELWFLNINTLGDIVREHSININKRDVDVNKIYKTDNDTYLIAGSLKKLDTTNKEGLIVELDKDSNLNWTKTINSGATNALYDVQQTLKGNYLFSGYSYDSTTLYDGLFIDMAYDDELYTLNKILLDTNNKIEYTIEANDGGYIGVGYKQQDDKLNSWIVKLDTDLNVEWEKVFTSSLNSALKSIVSIDTNNYMIAGYYDVDATNTDIWIARVDNSGVIVSDFSYGNSDKDIPTSLTKTDDGYALVGYRTYIDGSGSDYLVLRYNLNNELQVGKIFPTDSIEISTSIITDDADNLVVGGISQSLEGLKSSYVHKLDINLDTIWFSSFGTDVGHARLLQTTANNHLVVGSDLDAQNNRVSTVVKYGSDGNTLFSKSYNINTANNSQINNIVEVDDGFVAIGWISEDNGYQSQIFKIDFDGNLVWDKLFGSENILIPNSIVEITNTKFLLSGYLTDSNGVNSSWFTKYVVSNEDPVITFSTSLDAIEDQTGAFEFSLSDGDSLDLSVEIKSQPLHGTVSLVDNIFTYIPENNYAGVDTFIIILSDKDGSYIEQVISINIVNVNDSPTIDIDDNVTTYKHKTVYINYTTADADEDTVEVSIQTEPLSGQVQIVNNKLEYIPDTNFVGSDSLVVQIDDGNGGVVQKTININVLEIAVTHFVKEHNSTVGVFDYGDGQVYSSLSDITNIDIQNIEDVEIDGNYMYIAAYSYGLKIMDISNPELPNTIGTYSDGYAFGVSIQDSYAYVASGADGLKIIDISTPSSPQVIGVCDTAYGASKVKIKGDYAYVTDGNNGLVVIDISTPSSPTQVGGYDTVGYAYNLFVKDDYAYIADGDNGLVIINISDPTAPFYETGIVGYGARSIAVRDNYVYIATQHEYQGLSIVDISNFTALTISTPYLSSSHYPRDIALYNNYLYLTTAIGLKVVSIANPASPKYLNYVSKGNAMAVASFNNYIYTGTANDGLFVDKIDTVFQKATYSVDSGADSSYFEFDEITNILEFNISPDYEYPLDLGLDNIYEVTTMATNSDGLAQTQDVTIMVENLPNESPKVTMDTNITINKNDILELEFSVIDDDGDDVSILIQTDSEYGVTTLNDTSVTYVPNENYKGLDSFTLTFDDSISPIVERVVNIKINEIPVISVDTSAQIEENGVSTIVFSTTDGDGDTITPTVTSDPANGQVSIVDLNITYNPNENYIGSDSFTVTFDDGNGGVIVKEIIVEVSPKTNTYIVNENNNTATKLVFNDFHTYEHFDKYDSYTMDIDTSGDYGYIAGDTNIKVIDIQNPEIPVSIGDYFSILRGYDVTVDGNYVYIAADTDGLFIYDTVSSQFVGKYDTNRYARDVKIKGTTAYIADSNDLVILDISNPSSPILLGSCYIPGGAGGLSVSGDYAYVASYSSGLTVVDISISSAPEVVGNYDTVGSVNKVSIVGDYAYIADHNNGLVILDISTPSTPIFKGSYDTVAYARDVVIYGNYAYVTDDYNGLVVINISTPATPEYVTTYDTPGNAKYVSIDGDKLYVTDQTGLVVLDISSPASPTLAGSIITTGTAYGVSVSGNYAYIADYDNDLVIVDISNPTSLEIVRDGTLKYPLSIKVEGDYAYIADREKGLVILNVSNPTAPTFSGSYDTGYAYEVAVDGDYAYVASAGDGLDIIDISNPLTPTFVGKYDSAGYVYGVVVKGDYAYIADYHYGLVVVDISTPSAPTLVGSYNTLGLAYGVAVNGNYAYIADKSNGLVIIDISDPSLPVLVGGYDTADATKVTLDGNYAYIADYNNGLVVIDISDPSSPSLAGGYNTLGQSQNIKIVNDYIYIADRTNGLEIIKPIAASYSTVNGKDSSLFEINYLTNELTFIDYPDYENPLDIDVDNIYEVEITAINQDGQLYSKIIQIEVENLVNEKPVVSIDTTINTNKNEVVYIPFIVTDDDGDTVSVTITISSENGIVEIIGSDIRYTPSLDYLGEDSFRVSFDDENGGVNEKNIAIHVNEIPVIVIDDVITVNEDNNISLVFSYTDGDGDTVVATEYQAPSNGNISINETTIIYTPALNFFGSDTFILSLSDGHGYTTNQTISVTIESINDEPIITIVSIIDDAVEDTQYNLEFSFSDVDGDIVTASIHTEASHGSVSINGTMIIYTPDENYNGSDSFVITMTDNAGYSTTKTISLNIESVNDIPVITIDSTITIDEDNHISLTFNIADVEDEALTLVLETNANNGEVTIDATYVTYTPSENFYGDDTFTLSVTDSNGAKVTKTIAVTITSINDIPIIEIVSIMTTDKNKNTSIEYIFSDADGDIVSASINTQAIHGIVSVDGTMITYVPNINYYGTDTFVISMTDSSGYETTKTIDVIIKNTTNTIPAIFMMLF